MIYPAMPFSELVEINPRVLLPRDSEVAFVDMEAITPGKRYVTANKRRVSGGGTKFAENDTLFARITPCLENGKIAQFKGASVGLGSTEFFIFRARPDVSDPGYIFYLASSSIVRKPAERSMSGASGRQRADVASIRDLVVPAPPLPTQHKIAAVLSSYDDLIENNTRRIQILEEMARALYREWFVEFRFPTREKIPKVPSEIGLIPYGWGVGKLGDCVELAYGKSLKSEERIAGDFPVYGSSGIVGTHEKALVKGPGLIVGRKGNVGSVFRSRLDFYPIDTVYYVKTEFPLSYIYYNLSGQNFLNNDAAVPGLNRSQAYLLPLLVPPSKILERFDNIVQPIFEQTDRLRDVNSNLRATRDLLLPKLLSGEVDVSDLAVLLPDVKK